ncbi:MAG: ATP-dependent helicase [Deltaproteobacteria bacterium]|nr:ATP-dependent helicase [Deltaproteobacteria bacterium]
MTTGSAFDRLNPAQLAAARFGERGASGVFGSGPVLIIAGAGTGKTNTLAHRVAHLVLHGISPDRILLLTFTRRAAQEMTRRAQTIVAAVLHKNAAADRFVPEPGLAVKLPWSGTFHSIANRLIRRYAARVGLDASFSVLDRGDAADLMDVVRYELGLSKMEKRFPRKDTCLAIYSHRVNTQRALGDTLASAFPWCAEWEEELARLYGVYVERKLANHALDYDDLLLYWHAMASEPSLADEMNSHFDHILVDEYQDTNVLQAEILKALRPSGSGLTVVGDDAQSIYSFRAATIENILSFPAQYVPPASVVTLEQNYRSTQGVLDAANALIAEGQRHYRKSLKATRGGGERPRYVTVADEQAQADYVVGRVLEARERGVALKRQSVLFRSSHHSDVLELELVRRNIPYVKYGGLKFLEAAHVKDLLAVLRWADNPKNRVSAFRVFQLLPGMGPASAGRCFSHFEAAGHTWRSLASFVAPPLAREAWPAFTELMRALATHEAPWQGQVGRVREWFEPHLERIYETAEARAADLMQLERIAQQFATRERFLTELALDPPQASSDLAGAPQLDEDYLILSTIHSAKGQEWEAVYVLNVADGNFPSEFSTGRAELIEEERRLLYVAMTRAKRELHLIAPLRYYVTQQPRRGDAHVYGARSRFISPAVLAQLEEVTWPDSEIEPAAPKNEGTRLNLAQRLRGLWSLK